MVVVATVRKTENIIVSAQVVSTERIVNLQALTVKAIHAKMVVLVVRNKRGTIVIALEELRVITARLTIMDVNLLLVEMAVPVLIELVHMNAVAKPHGQESSVKLDNN